MRQYESTQLGRLNKEQPQIPPLGHLPDLPWKGTRTASPGSAA
jgi:hypothetical protein